MTIIEDETFVNYPCPEWCSDKLGCKQWEEYPDHAWRHHRLPVGKMVADLNGSEYDDRELRVAVDIAASERLTPVWARGGFSRNTRAPAVSVNVCRRGARPLAEVDFDLTAEQALYLADLLRMAGERLLGIEGRA